MCLGPFFKGFPATAGKQISLQEGQLSILS
jgi:hypothetical protein